jgi:hypothetical protein
MDFDLAREIIAENARYFSDPEYVRRFEQALKLVQQDGAREESWQKFFAKVISERMK